jgi:agmatinase
MEVKELIKDPGIWAGQNKPGLPVEEADIVVFSIPFDGGVSFRAGAKDAPQALREITYTISPTTELFESFDVINVVDLGDIPGESRDELFKNAERATSDIVKAGKFFVMIGGDHSVTIPVQKGVDDALNKPFGIIHIDAHFDLCDKLNGDSLSHGSTERRALELNNISGIESIFFLGIRSIEMDELDFIRKNGVHCLSANDMAEIGIEATVSKVKEHFKGYEKIYLTLDIDCLDPAYAPGTGTPQFGGLTARELLGLLRGLFDLPIIGMDVVEVAPKLDSSLVAVFAARKIITECWGHHLRSRKKLK